MQWPCNIIAYKRKFCVMFHLHSNYVHVIYYKQSSEDKLLHAMEKGSKDMLSLCLMIWCQQITLTFYGINISSNKRHISMNVWKVGID